MFPRCLYWPNYPDQPKATEHWLIGVKHSNISWPPRTSVENSYYIGPISLDGPFHLFHKNPFQSSDWKWRSFCRLLSLYIDITFFEDRNNLLQPGLLKPPHNKSWSDASNILKALKRGAHQKSLCFIASFPAEAPPSYTTSMSLRICCMEPVVGVGWELDKSWRPP